MKNFNFNLTDEEAAFLMRTLEQAAKDLEESAESYSRRGHFVFALDQSTMAQRIRNLRTTMGEHCTGNPDHFGLKVKLTGDYLTKVYPNVMGKPEFYGTHPNSSAAGFFTSADEAERYRQTLRQADDFEVVQLL